MKLFLGADHRGFERKNEIKTWLESLGHEVVDCGNTVLDPLDDYPDFAFAVAQNVAADPNSRGIIFCGSGTSVTIAANKIDGIRAADAFSADEVRHSRKHDDLNVLAIAADYTSTEDAKTYITVFLTEPFSPQEKYIRRIKKIEEQEKVN